jgi:hypothetical protein
LISVADAIKKRDIRELYFDKQRERYFLPHDSSSPSCTTPTFTRSSSSSTTNIPMSSAPYAATHVAEALRHWAMRFDLPPGEANVLMSMLGTLGEIVTADDDPTLQTVPIDDRTKRLLHVFFGSKGRNSNTQPPAPETVTVTPASHYYRSPPSPTNNHNNDHDDDFLAAPTQGSTSRRIMDEQASSACYYYTPEPASLPPPPPNMLTPQSQNVYLQQQQQQGPRGHATRMPPLFSGHHLPCASYPPHNNGIYTSTSAATSTSGSTHTGPIGGVAHRPSLMRGGYYPPQQQRGGAGNPFLSPNQHRSSASQVVVVPSSMSRRYT